MAARLSPGSWQDGGRSVTEGSRRRMRWSRESLAWACAGDGLANIKDGPQPSSELRLWVLILGERGGGLGVDAGKSLVQTPLKESHRNGLVVARPTPEERSQAVPS